MNGVIDIYTLQGGYVGCFKNGIFYSYRDFA